MRTKLVAALCLTVAILAPASALATTVRLGPALPESVSAFLACGGKGGPGCVSLTVLQRTLPGSGVALAAPSDGMVAGWSVLGVGTLKLHVLRPVGESVISEGTSAAAVDLHGASNATDLPIRAGDVIAVDIVAGSSVGLIAQGSATASTFDPAVPEDALADSPTGTFNGNELFFNATVVLAPSVGGMLPTSGRSIGGDTVKIVGANLDGATGVTFGNSPATFTVDSPGQITATAPSAPPSTVDVRVTGPGGTSAISAADKYTFTATPGGPTTSPSLISPLTAGQPTLTALAQTASKWRRGHQQAKISRAPVGTTFSFNLSKPAMVTLAFTQKAAGRRVRGACKPKTPSNASKRKCTRTILAGSLSLPGHAGLNKLRFQGLLPNGKGLKLGSYNVALTARDSDGLQSAPQSLSFSIVG
jgi:hypothetical protein